ncbi:LOW QUALITY PROTEIN: hypothetical protein V2J09_023835 [Rumex salicifolius]
MFIRPTQPSRHGLEFSILAEVFSLLLSVSAIGMATAEQPLKKRKLYDILPPEPPTQLSQQPPRAEVESKGSGETVLARPATPPPLSQEEIQRRRRNQEEIRNVFEIFKTLKRCASSNDSRFMPELERAYLSLITASRGCTSVQRIVSAFIPRYASYCPTALEAATQAIINIHSWSMPVISRGEDGDRIAFEISMNCITGLVDICCAASSIGSTPSVIQGICFAVFRTVLSFFASTLEGKGLFQIIDKEALKMQDSSELFSQIKQKVSSEDGHALVKLLKLRAFSLLQIIFSCPRDLLAVCFDLLIAPASEECYQEGKYFLDQLVNGLHSASEQDSNGSKDVSKKSATADSERNRDIDIRPFAFHDIVTGDVSADLSGSLLGLVLKKNPSLKSWILSRYKKLSQSASSQSASKNITALRRIVESCKDIGNAVDRKGNCDEENSVASSLSVYDGSCRDDSSRKSLGVYRKLHSSVASVEVDYHRSSRFNHESEGNRSMDFKSNDHVDVTHVRSSMSVDLPSNQLPSPTPRKPLNFIGDNFEAGDRSVQVDKNQISNVGAAGFSGNLGNNFLSNNHIENGFVWICDGDPAALDVFSASRQLWLGSLPPDVSEGVVRYHVEGFGPLENFYFCPTKGYALVEYRSIMDAIKAREYMRNCSPWKAPIRVKFMDSAMGSRGSIDGVAIGSSCFVYVGNIFSQWMKDDILRETRKVIYRGPRTVTELVNEGALLMEFGTPEEAANLMSCLRQHRRGNNNFHVCSTGPADIVRSHSNTPRNMSTNMLGSPHTPARAESHSGMHITAPHMMKADHGSEFVSPRASFNTTGLGQGGPMIQSNWPQPPCADRPEPGTSNCDVYNNSMGCPNPSQGAGPRTSDPTWTYRKPDFEHHSVHGTPSIPVPTPSPTMAPSPQIHHPPPYMRPVAPVYYPPSSSWDPHGLNHHVPYNTPPPNVVPPNARGGPIPPPFIPASVTPLSQVKGSGNGTQQFNNQMVYHSVAPPVPSVPPPLPPSPPPLPPPPPPDAEPAKMEIAESSLQIHWQGSLSKSGVHYCTISARRLDSDICKYSTDLSEPADWPAKLDMTKRTDFRHVKSTFSNSQPNRREVCQLLPASAGDYKGFQDFMSYLKQRECAGVIKIPAVNSLWTRLVFILPCSPEACSLLSVTPDPSDCLIAVILPKESNHD